MTRLRGILILFTIHMLSIGNVYASETGDPVNFEKILREKQGDQAALIYRMTNQGASFEEMASITNDLFKVMGFLMDVFPEEHPNGKTIAKLIANKLNNDAAIIIKDMIRGPNRAERLIGLKYFWNERDNISINSQILSESSDIIVRLFAAERDRTTQSLSPAIEAISNSDGGIRVFGYFFIADKTRDKKIILDAIRKETAIVRKALVDLVADLAMGTTLDDEVENTLRWLLDDKNAEISCRALMPYMISQINRSGLGSSVFKSDKTVLKQYARNILESSNNNCIQAATALLWLGDDSQISLLQADLMKYANSGNRPSSYGSLQALKTFYEERSLVDFLIRASYEPGLERFSVNRIGFLGGAESIPRLSAILESSTANPTVKQDVIDAIKKINDKSAIPTLSRTAASQDETASVRIEAIDALLQLGDKTSAQYLLVLAGTKEKQVRLKALTLIPVLEDEAMANLMSALKDDDPEVRSTALIAFVKINGERSLPTLYELAKDDDPNVRSAAIIQIGKLDADRAESYLNKIMNEDKSMDVRMGAAIALANLKSDVAIPLLIDAVKSDTSDAYEYVRKIANIGSDSAMRALKTLFQSDNERLRVAVSPFLAMQRDSTALEFELLQANRKQITHYLYYPEERWDALLINGKSNEILKLFREHPNISLFNKIRWDINKFGRFDILYGSDDLFVHWAWAYLSALKAREEGRYDDQLKYALIASESIKHNERTAEAILSLWVQAQAEERLGKSSQSIKTLIYIQALLPTLAYLEKRFYQELFYGRTNYLLGVSYSNVRDWKNARNAFERALDEIDIKRRDPLWEEPARRLETLVRTGVGLLGIHEGRDNLEQAIKIGQSYKPRESIEMESEIARYHELAKQKIAEGNYEDAQRIIEELNLRRSVFINNQVRITINDATKQKYFHDYMRIRQATEEIDNKIRELTNRSQEKDDHNSIKNVTTLQLERNNKQRELQTYLTNLKKSHPDLAALLGARPVDLTMIQEQLPGDVAVLQYLLLSEKLITFVIKKNGIEIVESQIDKNNLERQVRELRKAIFDKNLGKESRENKKLSAELNDLLIRKIEESGKLKGIKTVGIAPNGFLHQLPFAALMDSNGQYLIDRYNVFYINSTSILYVALDRAKQRTNANSLLAVSNPDGTLEYSDKEVNDISGLFNKKNIYQKADAKKAVIQGISNDTSVVHLSTHGVFNPIDSTKSYLKMADGNLTVEDIWGLPLKGVSMTTLSACETGIGETLSGDDVVSLENAFIYAGSPSVLATLWKIEDKSTAELMTGFYQGVSKGMTKAEALTTAQRQIREKYKNPYFWAAFTLRGDWR